MGATIVGRNAGELIFPWDLAISQDLKIGSPGQPRRSLSDAERDHQARRRSYYTPTLFSSRIRKLVRFLGVFG